MDMAKIIIFDMGGVLVHLNWDAVLAPLTKLSSKGADAVRRELVNGPTVKDCMLGRIGSRELHTTLCGNLDVELEYPEFLRIWVRMLQANDDILPLVERLQPRHKLVLGSNTDEVHHTYCLQHVKALALMDESFLSFQMGLLKPDPQFFIHILSKLGAGAADCVFIDDTPENVEAARSVSMAALGFTGNDDLQKSLTAIL
jgi:putative hydrolase of the HAD superfamily